MSGKFYNLDTRNTLGGDGASDFYVASQKAVKEYVDTAISTLPVVNTEYLKDLKDVNLTSLANGQTLVYNTTKQKWENVAIDISIATWGKITGSISAQTDLNNALSAKADISHTHVKSEITDLVLPTALSDLTDDLGDEPVHTHKQYLTEHQDISGKQDIITSTNKLSSDLVDDTNRTHKFVTSTQINTWNNKQDAISDLSTIRALATSALQTGDNVSSLTNDAGYLTAEDISSVFVYKGSKATVDQLPTTGNKKGDVWTVASDGSEYVWNGTSWEYLGEILDLSGYQTKLTATNKLNADYIQDGTTNKVVTQTEKNTWSGKQDALSQTQLDNIEAAGTALQPNDNVSELVNDAGYLTEHQDISGKQDKIDSTHKLSADLVDDSTSTNKFVTAANKTTWNNKQDAISDLTTIRANATAGKAAKDAVDAMGDIVSHNASEFQEAGDYAAAEHTHAIADITDLQTTLNSKQDTIGDLATIRANATAGAGAATTIAGYGDIVTHNANEFLTEHQDISGKADKATTLAGYGITDAYTKTQIDGMVAAGMHYKGTKASASALPTTGNQIGDLWNVTDTGANYAWNGTEWDKLSENIDLSGYQTLLSSTNTLNPAFIAQDSTHRFVSDTEKTTWGNKQDAISDLTTIRANATAGKGAADTIATYGDIVSHDAEEFANATHSHAISDVSELQDALDGKASTSHTHGIADVSGLQTALDGKALKSHTHNVTDVSGAQAEITTTNKLSADLIADGTTNKVVTATEKSTWNNKQNAISDLTTIRANATAGKEAADTISGYGDIVTHNADEFLTEHQSLAGYVPTSRKVNGKALTADITLSASDVSALPADTEIPTVNNVNITIQRNGTAVGTIKTNQSTASAINITVPTTYSDVSAASAGHTHTYSDVGAASENHTHTYSDVGAASANHTHSNYATTGHKHTSGDITILTGYTIASTASAIAASDTLNEALGKIQKSIDGKQASGDYADASHTHTKSDITDFPTIPTVYDAGVTIKRNGTAVGSFTLNKSTATNIDITVPTTYTDVNAASASHTHTYSDVGAASEGHTHNYVPTSRKVAGKTLTADITLSASDVGALPSDTVIPTVNDGKLVIKKNSTAVGTFTANQTGTVNVDITVPTTYSDVSAASAGHTHTYSDVGAASSGHTHSNYVVTTRKVAGHALSADVTLSSTDITDLDTTITTAISGKANTTEVYTKSEIDGKLSGAMHFKGTVASASALPTTGNTQGDMYNVTDTGANYAWDGSVWDKLSENVDLSGLVPNTRTVNGKTLNTDITLTYSDVGAASSGHTHNYVPTSRKINGKTLNADVTLSYTDVGALSAETVIPTVPTNVSAFTNDAGYLTVHQDLTDYQKTETAVTHTKNTAVGNTITPVYVNASGVATALSYTIAKSVPADAKFSDTIYTAGAGLSLSGTQFKHINSVEAGTVGTDTATSGSTLAVPFITYDAQGHITATGTHTHTVTGFSVEGHTHTKSEITDFPTIPTVNNSGVTIKRNGTTVGSFTLNKSTATNIDITVPTTYTDVGAASAAHTHTYTYSDVGAASEGHTHTYSDVGAASSAHTHTYSDVGAASSAHTHSNYVPTSRKINGKTLSADVTLTYTDVSAASDGHTHTYSDVGAASAAHTHSNYAAATHYHASNSVTVMTGYTKASASASITATDSLNTAIGKLEYKIDNASGGGASEIDGISGSTINRYCACSTTAATAAKTANITSGTPTLIAGLRVTVKFSNRNTADSPTFNLNSLGAKNIFVDGEQITTGSNKGILNGVLDLVYDGTQWQIVGSTMATVGMIA